MTPVGYADLVTQEQATSAEEEYLQTIYWLMEAGLPITGANIARAMQLSPPTVHEMLGRLESDGYVVRADDKSLRFSPDGERHAKAIVRRHRLIERFLTDVVGVAWDEVHEEAERLEHAMSPVFESWMLSSIGDAETCPHGHPIDPGRRAPGVPLADVEPGARIEVLRFENEAEDVLHYLKEVGLRPGLQGSVLSRDASEVVVGSDGGPVSLTLSVAETVSVKADPSPEPRTALPEQLVLGKERYGR
jgi:DtxR family Mn-dependent transcriptional regulator